MTSHEFHYEIKIDPIFASIEVNLLQYFLQSYLCYLGEAFTITLVRTQHREKVYLARTNLYCKNAQRHNFEWNLYFKQH